MPNKPPARSENATQQAPADDTSQADIDLYNADDTLTEAPSIKAPTPYRAPDTPEALQIDRIQQTGTVSSPSLTEISGMSTSLNFQGVLYVINDSGNSPTLHALDERGQLLASWPVQAPNRDWEDLASFSIADSNFIIIGDTGDNLQTRDCSVLHFIIEPSLFHDPVELKPSASIKICYDDGPRNVEAFTIIENMLYLLSKEPIGTAGRSPSGVYRVSLPSDLAQLYTTLELPAIRVADMPLRDTGIEGSLVAALAGVDLSHPTSMDFDSIAESVYILTYREVLKIRKRHSQTWSEAFAAPAEQIMSHTLGQAEALTVSPGRAVWFTSESTQAPIWAIPLTPPL
jgi:hypothetical protein